MTEQQRDPDNPFGYHNPELQDPNHQGDWSKEKFQSIEQAYSEYEKLQDPEKRYPIPEWMVPFAKEYEDLKYCLLYTSPSPRDKRQSRMPSSA